jgi:hypothetical protein
MPVKQYSPAPSRIAALKSKSPERHPAPNAAYSFQITSATAKCTAAAQNARKNKAFQKSNANFANIGSTAPPAATAFNQPAC